MCYFSVHHSSNNYFRLNLETKYYNLILIYNTLQHKTRDELHLPAYKSMTRMKSLNVKPSFKTSIIVPNIDVKDPV